MTSVISSTGAFKIVLQERGRLFDFSPTGLGLFLVPSQEQEKATTTAAFLAQFLTE